MQSTLNIEQFIPDSLMKLTYQAFQYGKSSFSLAHKNFSTQLRDIFLPKAKPETQPLHPELLQKLQEKTTQLLEAEWEDAQQGVYPLALLFDHQWEDFFRYYPAVWLNMPDVWQRVIQKQYQQFSPEIDQEGYPSYYLQNFHHQTDGYLSDFSANLYDLQVEILFNGTADGMRRRILAPLKQGLKVFESEKVRVLDVACGTGRILKFIRAALPKASLFGIDLSPAYLRKANQLLAAIPGELPQLLQANGEELPYQDNYFHGVSCVFLFHELPPAVRQQVIEESFRVIQPGGIYVICDSIQSLDLPEFKTMMENFPVIFHEPYYKSYISDDLVARLEKAGFENIRTENHLVSKYWIAQKPCL
ncbi:MAG: class I SAM-dependent methyltransferase [Gomphosphaeria aponina SAG 52.96 = DSM 107014]|uniref:Class I SAM-dependent methyltransferase n=1 Tax=Gomphosphaeria aponina SAG 52.96 = DSM 107014 TaxID=1521640 RepID=A0A941GR34_9CHRO|nr:class I SAM-dependent methyltransferase [Gomphosphaeria aponina SAG 52.96 = DSM 107014]